MRQYPPGVVTGLLASIRAGDNEAQVRLFELVERDLREIAGAQMRGERPGHTLQPTELVSELCLKLIGRGKLVANDRKHFFAIARQAMQNILIDHARRKRAARRDGGHQVLLDEGMLVADAPQDREIPIKQWLEGALGALAKQDQRQAQIVDLFFFTECSKEDVADLLGVSVRTIQRELKVASLFIRRHLSQP